MTIDNEKDAAPAPRGLITITGTISIDPREIEQTFIRSAGPGGQNVNKVSSAVQLRFDIRHSPSLPDYVRAKAEKLAGSRLTKDGVIVIQAMRYRTQEQNRDDALERLVELLKKATERQAYRVKTKPTKASKKRRLEAKTKRGVTKKLRSGKVGMD